MFTGKYIEVGEMEREYDGDYIYVSVPLRIVTNGSDNTRKLEYHDTYGTFVQEMTKEEIHELVMNEMFPEIREDLRGFFSDEKVSSYLSKYSDKRWLDNIKI